MIGLTREADGALRMAYLLAKQATLTDATVLAECASLSPKFALKILRKLTLGGIVCSKRGKSGGYQLGRPVGEITVRQLIECIDGPIAINRCAAQSYCCSRMGYDKAGCAFHRLFAAQSERLADDLDRVTLQMILQEGDTDGDCDNECSKKIFI